MRSPRRSVPQITASLSVCRRLPFVREGKTYKKIKKQTQRGTNTECASLPREKNTTELTMEKTTFLRIMCRDFGLLWSGCNTIKRQQNSSTLQPLDAITARMHNSELGCVAAINDVIQAENLTKDLDCGFESCQLTSALQKSYLIKTPDQKTSWNLDCSSNPERIKGTGQFFLPRTDRPVKTPLQLST